MNTAMETIFGLLGGLALFLFGMNLMSESLQKAAGEKMKSILGLLTKNPVLGVLAGALTTAVLQSSSATTVMVIGFVSAGLMSLPQAISVILGANIGTTMTAQLLAFKISDYIWPIVFIGFMIQFLAKKEQWKNIGNTIFAFGVLFVGIETMGSVMEPLAASPVFTELIGRVCRVPILGVLVGAGMTLVVQSSSATIAVLQNFASQPGPDGVSSVIGLTGAIPILLGDNIGTTITALLASVGQSKDAKRTALAHSTFNITGSFLFIWIIPWFAKFVEFVSPKGAEVEVISRQIANAHTLFNVINTLIWLPLIWLMVKIVMFLVPERPEREQMMSEEQPRFLDFKVVNQAVFSMHLASKELVRCAFYVNKMLADMKRAVLENSSQASAEVYRVGAITANLKKEMERFVNAYFSSGVLTEVQAAHTADLLSVLEDVSRVGDCCLAVTRAAEEKQKKQLQFSTAAQKELEEGLSLVQEMYGKMIQNMMNQNEPPISLEAEDEKVRKMEFSLRKKHKKRIQKRDCNPELTSVFSGLVNNMVRISNNCLNLSDTAKENFKFDYLNDHTVGEEGNALPE